MVFKKIAKILVVDDEKSILDSIKRMLYGLPYEIDTTTNVTIASKLMEENKYGLVLFDFLMIETNGYVFLQQNKYNKYKAKMVLMTGYIISEIIDKCIEMGADGYLLKPFDKENLLNCLNEHLAKEKTE